MASNIKPTVRLNHTIKNKLITRLKFSSILNLPEREFASMIQQIEEDPLFGRLNEGGDAPRAIFRKRYPHTRLSSGFYSLKEEILSGSQPVDVESLLLKHKRVLSLVKKIGRDNFEKHFLYKESPESPESIAALCGITADETRKIQSLINDLAIQSEFFHPSALAVPGKHYYPVARIETEADGTLILSYLSPHLARGRYIVNRERLETLKQNFSKMERKSLSALLKKIEWANLRTDTLQKILNELILKQEPYLRRESRESLLPLSQREMARIIGVAPSTVSRIVFSKSVFLPWGDEAPLKDFFLKRKEAAQKWLADILRERAENRQPRLNDGELKDILEKRYHVHVSRRTVNLYRREIRI